MDKKQIENILAVLGVFLLVALIFNVLKKFNTTTNTAIISDKGLEALKNPKKKEAIESAIDKAREEQEETGIWQDPIVDLK